MRKNLVLSGIVTILFWNACTSDKKVKEEVVKYAVTTPLKLDTTFVKEYVSQIRSVRNIEIRAQERGFLQKIYVDEGQYVKAGQPLFRIMPKAFEAELLKAQAEAKAAEIELRNAQMLVGKNIISKNEQAMAQTKLDQARAETALARLHLSFTEIKAPFSGTIDRIPKKLGSLIDDGELMTSLSDNSEMFAYFNVSEPEYLDYETNKSNRGDAHVSLLLANNQLLAYKGEVETVESEFDSETGNIAFRARFPNPNRLLRNGETGKIQMQMPMRNALIIPQKATYELQDKVYVFVVNAKNHVQSRQINIRAKLPDLYVVESGLNVNDKILLEGVQKVKDDDKISFEMINARKVLESLKLKAE